MIDTVKLPKINKGDKIVSYSQFSIFDKCPHKWELTYLMGMRVDKPNIHLLFGNAMHNLIQEYIGLAFEKGTFDIPFDYRDKLYTYMETEYVEMTKRYGGEFVEGETIVEYYNAGVEIMIELKERLSEIITPSRHDFLGAEVPLVCIPIKGYKKVKFRAYIDLLFFDRLLGKYIIIDIKTSKKGWDKYKKNDMTNLSQMMLYKWYFSLIYGIPVSAIDVEYLIVKKDVIGKDSHIQRFKPEFSDSVMMERVDAFKFFVRHSYMDDGTYDLEGEYPPVMGGSRSPNCRFCEYVDNHKVCPIEKRLEYLC